MDNGRTLSIAREEKVEYADFISGSEGMTMLVRLDGGKNAHIKAPFIIFANEIHSYPIRGVPESLNHVSSRSAPKGWIDTVTLSQHFDERKAIKPLRNGRKRLHPTDDCSRHNSTERLFQALQRVQTDIKYFLRILRGLFSLLTHLLFEK